MTQHEHDGRRKEGRDVLPANDECVCMYVDVDANGFQRQTIVRDRAVERETKRKERKEIH